MTFNFFEQSLIRPPMGWLRIEVLSERGFTVLARYLICDIQLDLT